jgi:hypothetical protein
MRRRLEVFVALAKNGLQLRARGQKEIAMQGQERLKNYQNQGSCSLPLYARRLKPAARRNPENGLTARHRMRLWTTEFMSARPSGSGPAERLMPFIAESRAAENKHYGKQDAYRCGASGGDPGRRKRKSCRRI